MSEGRTIKVIIVDDHSVVRSGLSAFLLATTDMELVGEAESGEQAVEQVQRLQPDVVLMDMLMPGIGGVEATRRIRQQRPETQVIALTSFKDAELVQGAIQAGAIGYLLKDVTAAELADAVRAARRQKPTLAPEAAQVLIQISRGDHAPGFDLTGRERDILALLVEGLSNKDIADRLYLSPSTVKYYVSIILSKLGVSTRTEAVALAMKHHLVK